MTDDRIAKYLDAALAMIAGQFKVDIPTDHDDEIGKLGRALEELGHVLHNKFAEIDTLATVTEQVNTGLSLDDTLTLVFDCFKALIPYDRIGVALLMNGGRDVRARWARSNAMHIKLPIGYTSPMAATSLGQLLQTGEPRILNDLAAYLGQYPQSTATHMIVEEGMRSSLTCPLIAAGKPVGFIFFSSMQRDTYENAHIELYQQIAGQLAMIVEKSRLYEELLELNQLKNKFLGIAAHDLRSPINIIRGFSALFLEGHLGAITAEQKEYLGRIEGNCGRMLLLIDDLLSISAVEAGRLDLETREIDMGDYLRDCLSADGMLARAKNIALTLDVPADLPRAVIDPGRIAQVMNNLVSNAVKFSHEGTSVTVRARQQGQFVSVSVEDQGQGIPEEELPRLFSEFQRTSVRPTAGEKSTGLGLAIVKRMVQAHGGDVSVESRVGHGSVFSFTVPAVPVP